MKVTEIRDNVGCEFEYIATVDGEVVGRAELLLKNPEDKEAEFRIHLRPEFRGQGYGYKLTKYTIEQGLQFLNRIWLGVEESNQSAIKLYNKAGFKPYLRRMEICRTGQESLDAEELLSVCRTTTSGHTH